RISPLSIRATPNYPLTGLPRQASFRRRDRVSHSPWPSGLGPAGRVFPQLPPEWPDSDWGTRGSPQAYRGVPGWSHRRRSQFGPCHVVPLPGSSTESESRRSRTLTLSGSLLSPQIRRWDRPLDRVGESAKEGVIRPRTEPNEFSPLAVQCSFIMALRDPTAQEQDEGDSRNAELVASLAVDAQSTRSDRREVDRLVTPYADRQRFSLGDAYQEEFRLYLLGSAAFPRNGRLLVHIWSDQAIDFTTIAACT